MDWKKEWKILLKIVALFLICFFLPIGNKRFDSSITEALILIKDYARLHVLTCLIPAFFIAGAIGVFISQASVIKYLGAGANKVIAYSVASVSGSILAVCSCTIMPLFVGIYKMGAGIGPATTFLYAGPAINVLAIIMTANILGAKLGAARAIGAIAFSIVIGLCMHLFFGKEDKHNTNTLANMPTQENNRTLLQNAIYFASMIVILIFANFPAPNKNDSALWHSLHSNKWVITAIMAIAFAFILIKYFKATWPKIIMASLPAIATAIAIPLILAPQLSDQMKTELAKYTPTIIFSAGFVGLGILTATSKGELNEWFEGSWTFAKQILPLLLFGVIIAGLLLGSEPGEDKGLIPANWISNLVGGESLFANFFASIAGAVMYFATLTEVPIVSGLQNKGMGNGPALALLLAGPALSLPNMLVIQSVMGTKKTFVYIVLVVIMATISGLIYGNFIA